MADLAVGLVSLALQISKGLVWYIDGTKDAKDRRTRILEDTERLADCLERLDFVVKKTNPSARQDAATAGIVACAEALNTIETKLGCRRSISGSRFRQQMLDLGRRLTFPFRQEEIAFLKDVVSSTERHLQTALLALQLEAQNHSNRLIAQLIQSSQINFQLLHEQQSLIRHDLSQQSIRDTGSILSNTLALSPYENSTQAELASNTSSIHSMTSALSTISATFPKMESTLSRLEEKMDHISLREVSPKAVKGDVSDFTELASDMNRLLKSAGKKQHLGQRCTCRGRGSTKVYLKWPFHFTSTETSIHSPECVYAIFEEAVTNLQLRFTMCSIFLRRKAHIGLAVSHGAGSSSVSPMLKCDRIVTKRAPAFRLLANFEKRLGSNSATDAWEKPANELLRLFQLKKATPHDRLPNGMTLLHYFCRTMKHYTFEEDGNLLSSYHQMGKRLLEYLPTQATEQDDEGLTCIDYFVVGSHFALVEHFLDHGISVAIWRHIMDYGWRSPVLGMDISPRVAENLDCSEQMKVILIQSEKGLLDLIRRGKVAPDCQEGNDSIYDMATLNGWRRGCEILLDHGVEVRTGGVRRDSLLDLAIESKHEDMLRFWLECRANMGSIALYHIGSIEDTLIQLSRRWSDQKPKWTDICLSALVQQRQELKALAIKNFIPTKADRLPDAETPSLIRQLEARGCRVKSSLRPTRRSVYHVPLSGWHALVLDQIHEAGFCDTTAEDFMQVEPHSISPLMYLLTCFYGPAAPHQLAPILPWYFSHGAELGEKWPNSTTMMAHCLAYRLGNTVYYLATPAGWAVTEFPTYFALQSTDNCTCACSSMGCTFATSFCKGLTTPRQNPQAWTHEEAERQWLSVRRSWRDRLPVMEAFVGEAASRRKNRWLVTEFIRLAVFNELGIRHTCCDIQRIIHYGEPDYSKQPVPRHDDDDMELIQDEDADLVQLLEYLVQELDAKFEQSSGDVETFFETTFVDRMDSELFRLRRDDRVRYARGRSEMGVVMNEGDEFDEESSDESQPDSDDESFDEKELEG